MVTSLAKQVSDLRRLIEVRGHASSTPLYFRLDPDQDEATALNEFADLWSHQRAPDRSTAVGLQGSAPDVLERPDMALTKPAIVVLARLGQSETGSMGNDSDVEMSHSGLSF